MYSQNKSTVEFIINSDEFVMNEKYDVFVNETIPYIYDNVDNIESILLIGCASPEGDPKNNERLATKRAEKIRSYLFPVIPKNKIIKNNDYDVFLQKTGLTDENYERLRATYIEVVLKPAPVDTFRVVVRDTVRYETVNNYYVVNNVVESTHGKPKISTYNDLLSDVVFRANIGVELYFKKASLFLESSFSN